VADLIAEISTVMTLEPGDVIITGTPAGVGMGRNPKLFMEVGDVCEIEIEGIGTLRNPIARGA
jgi:acylpyruvate hydrolase